MAVNLSPVYGVGGQLFDNNGNPLAGGKIYTYLAGTTTNAATYTNATGSIAHSNPIVLDGAGRVPSGEIWLTDGISYKFVVEDSASALIGTYDNLVGINSNFVNFLTEQEIQTATAGQTVFTLTTMQYQVGTNNLTVYVDGVNQYGPGASYSYVETSSTVVTFTSGLHVGAEVKFTTAQTLSSGTTDASLVTYDPPFTGGVTTNVEAKLAQTISASDFGVVGDGVTDDTNNLIAAIAAAENKTLWISGTPLISDTILFDKPIKVVFDGPQEQGLNIPPNLGSYFIKESGMGKPGVKITTANFVGVGGGVRAKVAGADTGDGIVINGVHCSWYDPVVYDMGGAGIRIGSSVVDGTNSNAFFLVRPICTSNGNDGIYCHDVAPIDANAGTIISPQCHSNVGAGISMGTGGPNTIIAPSCEANTQYGIYFASGQTDGLVMGGDCEVNGVKDVYIASGATRNVFLNVTVSAFATIENNEPTTLVLQNATFQSLRVGTGSTTQAGLKILTGSNGAGSGYGAIYPENLSPSSTNYVLKSLASGVANSLNSTSNLYLRINNVPIVDVTNDNANFIDVSIEGNELASEPAAPAANGFKLFAVDNGSGKTVLKVKFASGAAQVIATEP
jgi:hypothetical protein